MENKRIGDAPGVWHHVMNRGIARRTVFESERDVRFFLSRLAYAVRARWLELHAYSVMTTHFHLLVRSGEAGLSHAMARVLNDYVRWFNRGRKRDGALFRGRFRSRVVDSIEYRRTVVRYIDTNAVQARMVPTAALYPHSSAAHYARFDGPMWLTRTWVESEVRRMSSFAVYDPRAYAAAFGDELRPGLARLIEQRLERKSRTHDPLADLVSAAPEQVLAWMRRKATLADGTRIGLPVCDAAEVLERVARARLERPVWMLPLARTNTCAWDLLQVGLARDLGACAWLEIGSRLCSSERSAMRAYRLHARALHEFDDYGRATAAIASAAIRSSFGTQRTSHSH
jgi:REP element-mobilizing transposase RayT